METIRTVDLTRAFDGKIAVDNLNLSVQQGEVYGLVGPDGAGKTTIMRLLAGVMKPTAGDAWVNGNNTIGDSRELKKQISYMPQRFGLYSDLTVQENIDFYADLYNVPQQIREQKITELLAFSNMEPFRDRQAGKLSGGMKQKLALACALVHTPKVLLLDEPTNGVDPLSRRDFWKILYKLLEEGVTIFVSTAYLDEAERCTRVGLLHQGKLIISGTPDEVKNNMRGVLVEVLCKEPRKVMDALISRLTLLSAGLFGAKIHLLLEGDSKEALQSVKDSLRDITVDAEAAIVLPSLEDIFISMSMAQEGSASHG